MGRLKLQQMVSKSIIGFLLCSTIAFGQVYEINCKTDSLVGVLTDKDVKIEGMQNMIFSYRKINKKHLKQLMTKDNEIDSLKWYKKYYLKSKEVLSPRVIARIEDEI